jgi:hypothetical protein
MDLRAQVVEDPHVVPTASNRSHRWEPMKPAPPVTRIFLAIRPTGDCSARASRAVGAASQASSGAVRASGLHSVQSPASAASANGAQLTARRAGTRRSREPWRAGCKADAHAAEEDRVRSWSGRPLRADETHKSEVGRAHRAFRFSASTRLARRPRGRRPPSTVLMPLGATASATRFRSRHSSSSCSPSSRCRIGRRSPRLPRGGGAYTVTQQNLGTGLGAPRRAPLSGSTTAQRLGRDSRRRWARSCRPCPSSCPTRCPDARHAGRC